MLCRFNYCRRRKSDIRPSSLRPAYAPGRFGMCGDMPKEPSSACAHGLTIALQLGPLRTGPDLPARIGVLVRMRRSRRCRRQTD